MSPEESVPFSFPRHLCTVYSDHELQVLFTFCYKPHIHFPSLKSLHIIRSFDSLCICCNMLTFTPRGFLPSRPIPKLDDHPLSALRNCLFSIFAATLHIRCATNRKVAGSIPVGVSGFFVDIKSFRSHYGPRVDSASNRNEYQEYFLEVKAASA